MATKTISIDLKAYERLRRARQNAEESFSRVIHRANWPKPRRTCGELLDALRRNPRYLPTKEVRALEKAQAQDRPPPRKWR